MSASLATAYYNNAMAFLKTERRKAARVNAAYRLLQKNSITASAEDWLKNPFVRTALKILQGLTTNPKVRESLRLLKEAGEEMGKGRR